MGRCSTCKLTQASFYAPGNGPGRCCSRMILCKLAYTVCKVNFSPVLRGSKCPLLAVSLRIEASLFTPNAVTPFKYPTLTYQATVMHAQNPISCKLAYVTRYRYRH